MWKSWYKIIDIQAIFFYRTLIIGENAKSVRLMVERVKGQGYDVEVLYNTLQMTSQSTVAGLKIYPALDGSDFTGQIGKLVFKRNTQVGCCLFLPYTM